MHKIFYSKVLLFGEHIINKGAMGLAVPFEHFDGIMKFAAIHKGLAWEVRVRWLQLFTTGTGRIKRRLRTLPN